MKQSLEDEIKFAKKDLDEAKVDMAGCKERKAVAEGDLAMTTKSLEADVAAKADLHQDCMTKADDFEATMKSAKEELKALAEAKKIIGEMTTNAADFSYSFLQRSSLRISSRADLARFEAVRFLRDLSRKQHSPALAQLASHVASIMSDASHSGEDPFAKIKGLISDMITRLEEEANSEAEHKAWCDKEIAHSTTKKEEKTSEISKLSTKIDSKSARSAQLKEEVAALQKALAELAATHAEMDKVRKEEKELFTKNKADLEQGIEAVKMALKILNDYYSKEDKAHAAGEGESTGTIGLLEVVEADFSKGLAEITATEKNAQAMYEQQTKDNEIDKTTKEQDVKYKTKESKDLDTAVAELSSDLATVQEELDAVLEYLAKLEDQCVAKAEPYEERKKAREEEIAGLKEALKILESEAAPVLMQSESRRKLRGIKQHASMAA